MFLMFLISLKNFSSIFPKSNPIHSERTIAVKWLCGHCLEIAKLFRNQFWNFSKYLLVFIRISFGRLSDAQIFLMKLLKMSLVEV